jgi:hypothetical protein
LLSTLKVRVYDNDRKHAWLHTQLTAATREEYNKSRQDSDIYDILYVLENKPKGRCHRGSILIDYHHAADADI